MFSTSKKYKQQPSTRVGLQEKRDSAGHCLTDKNMLPEYKSMPQNTIKLTGYMPPLNTVGRKHASEHHKTERIGHYLNTPQNNAELAENTPRLITTESFISKM
jgi:hypothetical protein